MGETATTGVKDLSKFLNSDSIKGKFTEILGQKGVGFISSVLSIVNSNKLLKNADQNSIYTAALMAASLDLPINPNLGFAYIVPYNAKQENGTYLQMAQFQIGYKGFIQLAQRTGLYRTLNSNDVREGEIKSINRLTGEIDFDWDLSPERDNKKIIGYVSYFQLTNGFISTLYWTVEEITAHAKKYSQTFKKYGTGLWKDEFPAMAHKTVTKMNLSKNGPLSIDMQRAVLSDQAVIKSDTFLTEPDTALLIAEYVDNPEETKIENVLDKKEKVKMAKAEANPNPLENAQPTQESTGELFNTQNMK